MLKNIKETIQKHNMLSPNNGVVVGLSGGADSVALLTVLITLREKYPLKLYAVHVNHNLRANAKKDEIFVQKICKDRGIPLRVCDADIRGKAEREKLSIEEAGRRVRYDCFYAALNELDAQKIAVGHNADDNAETVLLNLCRGAGLRGVCGIPPVNGSVVRPLLETPRAEIEAYLKKEGIAFIEDDSNAGFDYTRNRIRNIVLPAIVKHVNPSAAENIARNTAMLRADAEYLEDAAREAFLTCTGIRYKLDDGSPLSLNIPRLLMLPEALRNRVVREAIARARLTYEIDAEDFTDIRAVHIYDALKIANGETGKEAHLPGIKVTRSYDELYFTPAASANASTQGIGFYRPLILDKPSHIPEIGKTITLSLSPPEESPRLLCTRTFDYDILSKNLSDLCVRTRRKGDRVALPGGTKKLQDYFTDTKTPRHLRDTVALVALGGDIVWILDERGKINTKIAFDIITKENNPNTVTSERKPPVCWISIWAAPHHKEDIP